MPYRVFISHGWHDRWIARQMARSITDAAGADVFIDIFDVKKGDRIEETIRRELPLCDELVVLLTPWSVRRNWVWTEVGAAWGLQKRVVGVLYGVSIREVDATMAGWRHCPRRTVLGWTSSTPIFQSCGTARAEFEMSYKLFLSYAHDDKAFADKLAESIVRRGGELLRSEHGIAAGVDWLGQLRGWLDQADAFVMVMPKEHAASANNTFFEAGAAKAVGKDVMIVVPDLGAVDRDNIPFDLASMVVDASKQSIDKVASTVLGAVARD